MPSALSRAPRRPQYKKIRPRKWTDFQYTMGIAPSFLRWGAAP